MNVSCALQHFCDLHGPQILFCTETRPYIGALRDQVDDNLKVFFSEYFRPGNPQETARCKSCLLSTSSFVISSIDPSAHMLFVSSGSTPDQQLFKKIRHACVRSLNVERPIENESPVLFGDDENGYCISMIFSCKDFHARGSQRLYAMCYLCEDKYHLLSLMKIISSCIREIIRWIQSDAGNVFEQEGHIHVTSKSNGTSKVNSVARPPPRLPTARMLSEMLQDSKLIYRIHVLFVWLLRTASLTIVESLVDAPPTEDQISENERKELDNYFWVRKRPRSKIETTPTVSTRSFIFLSPNDLNNSIDLFSNSVHLDNDSDSDDFDSLQYHYSSYGSEALKIFRQFIIKLNNQSHLEYFLHQYVIGNRLFIKYRNNMDNQDFLRAFISVLRLLIPDGCCNLVETYEQQSNPQANLVLVDMNSIRFCEQEEKLSANSVVLQIKFDYVDGFIALACLDISKSLKLDSSVPTYVTSIIDILLNPSVNSEAFEAMVIQQKLKYLNKSKIYFQLGRCQLPSSLCRNQREQLKFLQLSDVNDLAMIRFWQKGLSNTYKAQIRTLKKSENQDKE